MKPIKTPFDFASKQSSPGSDEFIIQIPTGIGDKRVLLARYAKLAHFPKYFGCNWDALNDCLSDMSWIGERKIVIRHNDLPLRNQGENLGIYVDILSNVTRKWNSNPNTSHEMAVCFPIDLKEQLERILGNV